MSDTHEVISAFLDDEPFDPGELATALADPSGRTLLLDLIALRHIVQPEDTLPAGTVVTLKRRSALRGLLAAAAVFVALIGGYFVGRERSEADLSQPPAPTRVVAGPATWQDVDFPTRSR